MENLPEKPSLLRLPYSVRREIYSLLGVVGVDTRLMALGHKVHRPWAGQWCSLNRSFCVARFRCAGYCYHMQNQLFYVSRDVSADALHAFYSENKFAVSSEKPLVFKVVGGNALSALRRLTLQLNLRPTRCPCGRTCDDAPLNRMFDEKMPLQELAPCLNLVVQEWRDTLYHLGAHIAAGKLNLQINFAPQCFYPAVVLQSLRLSLAPLLEFPRLKNCLISLPNADRRLQPWVKRLVLMTTGQLDDIDPPFPFAKLPPELQLKVLEHAGLISDTTLVVSSNGFIPRLCWGGACFSRDDFFSCCSLTSSYYVNCDPCWVLPKELFDVNRRIRALSRYIFVSQNRFIISPLIVPELKPGWSPMCLSIDDLPHLRFLTLEFTGIDGNTHLPGQPNTLAWERFVDSAVNKLTLPALTLMVRMFHEDLDYLPNGVIYDDDAQMVAAYKAACQRIFDPLAHALKGQEHGLKRLFVAISSPIENLKVSGVRDYERVLERSVMGVDYDSHALGWDVLRRRVI
ncbi:conserved hypothetical protein [Coccidioides posadasii str. Silveira]|uniref:F-box domain-containing protein n=1 Tax=Coccidioides posadasii (strain RMSCC 757 / Silveira) TaxID=443226 RepID=E9CXD6_COCPS|nr:conserved hypothetical protein [Coccidioides posadasii str. Silveira]